jgi:hypothetical protein
MSKQVYPTSLNCWLRDYPKFIKIIFGSEMDNLDGPWNNGSIILLERIGIDSPDTTPVVDEIPPDIKVTYSDNGTDSDWIFKISVYGWGTFFATPVGSNYYVDLEKFFEFESIYFDKITFRYRTVQDTQIAKTETIPSVIIPEEIFYAPPPNLPAPNPISPIETESYWDSIAGILIEYYWWIWNLNRPYSVSVISRETPSFYISGRQIEPKISTNNNWIDFYISGGKLKLIVSRISIECEDFLIGEPSDCTYSLDIVEAYWWDQLLINGVDRLPDLIRRA